MPFSGLQEVAQAGDDRSNGGRCHFRHLASGRIPSARDAQPHSAARYTESGRIARKPRGIDRSQAVHWGLSSSLPRGAERPIGGDSPPSKMAIAMMEQRSHGGPGDRGGMGAPTGHRFCADSVVGYWRKGTPERAAGSRGIPPAGHATAWPWGHRDGGEEAWRLYPSATCYTRQSPPPLPR